MIFDCVAMDAERQKHQSLFARGRVALVNFHPGPYRICCFCARLLQGLRIVISDSVLFIYGGLVRRPVVGYLNRPKMVSNRLCNTSIIRYITAVTHPAFLPTASPHGIGETLRVRFHTEGPASLLLNSSALRMTQPQHLEVIVLPVMKRSFVAISDKLIKF